MGNQCDFKFLQRENRAEAQIFYFFFQKVLQLCAFKNKHLALGSCLPYNDVEYVLKSFYFFKNWPDGMERRTGPPNGRGKLTCRDENWGPLQGTAESFI